MGRVSQFRCCHMQCLQPASQFVHKIWCCIQGGSPEAVQKWCWGSNVAVCRVKAASASILICMLCVEHVMPLQGTALAERSPALLALRGTLLTAKKAKGSPTSHRNACGKKSEEHASQMPERLRLSCEACTPSHR